MNCSNVLGPLPQEDVIRRELQYLYDRRSAIEMLIRSLENYDRYRERPITAEKHGTA